MQENYIGYCETAKRFGVRHKRLLGWERIYLLRRAGWLCNLTPGRGSTVHLGKLSKEAGEDLLAEVERLRAENEYLKN